MNLVFEFIDFIRYHYWAYKQRALPFIQPYTRRLDIIDMALIWGATILIAFFILKYIYNTMLFIQREGLVTPLKSYAVKKLRRLPFVKAKIEGELAKTLKELEEEVGKTRTDKIFKLPAIGFPTSKIIDKIKAWEVKELELRGGKQMTGCMYARDDDEAVKVIKDYAKTYLYANPLHFEIFPSALQIEAELISMTLNLFHGPEGKGCGIVTSGGTESLLLACLAYRNLAYERGIKEPEIVMPATVHAAVNKACMYFNIRLITVPINQETGEVLVKKLKGAVSKNTCAVIVSVPNYVNGACDDVESIAAFCLKKNVPVHVDCCLGGFLVAFAERCEVKLPPFDFRVPGVTSISCDHHKYGLAPKGVSVVMFRDSKYRSHCMFAITGWSGGIYATPGISGSKGSAAAAGAWIAMVHLGNKGYKERFEVIFKGQKKLLEALKTMPEIKIVGEPKCGVIAIVASRKNFDIYTVHDLMVKKGWHINAGQKPPSIQFLLTHNNVQFIDAMIKELRECIKKVAESPGVQGDNKYAKLYASVAKLPRELVEEGAKLGLESFLKL